MRQQQWRKPVRRLLTVWLCGGLLAASAFAQDAAAPAPSADTTAAEDSGRLVITDLLRLRQLGDVTVSPDGRLVVYEVQSIVPDDARDGEYVYRTQLYQVSADGREAPRALTHGDAGAAQPAWHPEGDRLAFVRKVEGKSQVFVLPLYGGEAYQLTDVPYGASRPRWSPDGRHLLFSATLTARQVRDQMGSAPRWPSERPGRSPSDTLGVRPNPDGSVAQIRAWLDRRADAASPRVFTRLDLQGETDLEAEPSYRHLFVLDTADEAAPPRALTNGYYSFDDAVWMPDGKHVVFAGSVVLDRHPDRVVERELFTVALDGSGFRPFLKVDGYALSDPAISPRGRMLAFQARPLDDLSYGQSEVGVVELGKKTPPRFLTRAFDRSAGAPRWSDDGWYLYFTAASDGGFPLYRVRLYDEGAAADSLAGPAPDTTAVDSLAADTLAADSGHVAAVPREPIERLSGFDRGVRSFDLGRAAVFYVVTEAANPFELFASNLDFTRTRRLTTHNATWLAGKKLSVPEPHVLQRDTLEVPYWIMKPTVFKAGEQYPLLLQIHGGPSAMWGPGEASMWFEFQYFAARGYGVVFSNPRGSGGYGYAFQKANYRDWGAGPAGDVLAVAAAAAKLPWVDPARQVVTGGSYAGYLTAWIVAHDHRFRAAVAQRGVYDLATFMGEGNAWRLVPEHFGGYPWEEDRPVVAQSQPPKAPAADTAAVATDTAAVATDTAAVAADTSAVRAAAAQALAILLQTDATAVPDSVAAEPVVALDTLVAKKEVDLEETASPVPLYRALLLSQSPLTFVDQIRTPLLILHGDRDLRTGVIQSEVLYKSLKILGRPVEYVRYPDAGHELSRSGNPRHRMDRILRIYEFFERFL